MLGSKIWAFPDGDLPPAGDKEPFGHESLIILNPNQDDAHIKMTIYFEDKEPVRNIVLNVKAERVRCFRLDKPVGDGEMKYSIPFGQYAFTIESDVPVVAHFGRLDVRQPDLSYYSVQGYALG